MAQTVADADRLKALPKKDRPGEANMNQVRIAYADCMDELSGTFTSRSQLTDFELPSERLEPEEPEEPKESDTKEDSE
jgi:hypothetical protein